MVQVVSVTRLGEILTNLQNCKRACQFVRVYLARGKIKHVLWATFYAIGQHFIVGNGHTLEKCPISPSGHADYCVVTH